MSVEQSERHPHPLAARAALSLRERGDDIRAYFTDLTDSNPSPEGEGSARSERVRVQG